MILPRIPFTSFITLSHIYKDSNLLYADHIQLFTIRTSFGSILKRSMFTTVRKGSPALALAKQTFLKYSYHFNTLNISDLVNDKKVISEFKKIIDNDLVLSNRAFQLALEVSYSRRTFDTKTLLSIFDNEFTISNPLDPFDGLRLVDQSTIFNALISKILKQEFPKITIDIQQPPIGINVKDLVLSPTIEKRLAVGEQLTGNKIADFNLNNVAYDLKSMKTPLNTRNHIYIMPLSEESIKCVKKHLYDLSKELERTLVNDYTPFYENLLKALKKHKSLFDNTPVLIEKREIIKSWNEYLVQTLEQRPTGFRVPMYIILKENYIPDEELTKEPLLIPEGHLDYVKAKQVLSSIVDSYSPELKAAVYTATKGALGHVLNNIDNQLK